MAITSAQITRVRTLSDASVTDFSDDVIELAIAEYPRPDVDGNDPTSADWVERYDLYRAAADVVEQRAAKVITSYDVNSDGASLSRSQMQQQLFALATRLRCRGAAKYIARPTDETDTDADDEETGT